MSSALFSARSTNSRLGDNEHTGSVAAASPVSRSAWHRHPPKSSVRRSQLRHGSCIHSSPLNFRNASDSRHISERDMVRTFSKSIRGITAAAWQGRTRPVGSISISFFPIRPCMLSDTSQNNPATRNRCESCLSFAPELAKSPASTLLTVRELA